MPRRKLPITAREEIVAPLTAATSFASASSAVRPFQAGRIRSSTCVKKGGVS